MFKMWILILALSGICFFATGLSAQIPAGFAMLSDRSDVFVNEQNSPPIQKNSYSAWLPYARDVQRGFAAYVTDTSRDLNPNWTWSDINLSREIVTFACPGQYKSASAAVRTLRPINGLKAIATDLTSSVGMIAGENIDLRWVQYTHKQLSNPVEWEAKWLEKAIETDFPTQWTVWMWITIYVPSGTPAGTYNGIVVISDAQGHSVEMPVSVLVLDFELLHPSHSYGMYIPGHPYMTDKGVYKNYAAETYWKQENLLKYFQYWKTRGLNSPTLYGIYPDLKCTDGHTVIDVPFVRAVAQAMTSAGISGDLCIDTRWIEWWTSPVANEIQRRIGLGQPIVGDIGIYGWHGVEGILKYNDPAKRLYQEAIEQVIAYAQNENWPRTRFLAEEEVGGSEYQYKVVGYETFMPVLLQVDPNNAYLVDNSIGYEPWIPNPIDRGARDGLKLRQYNSWTEAGLSAAAADNAEVRGYNLGVTRSAWGQYQQRINSTGYHIWADQFEGARENVPDYMSARITTDGVLGSIAMERAREGIDDRAYYYTLENLVAQLDAAGKSQEASNARAVLAAVVGDVPLTHYSYLPWADAQTASILDAHRWNVVNAIQNARRALGQAAQTYQAVMPSGELISQRQGNAGTAMFADVIMDSLQDAVNNRAYYNCTMINDANGYIGIRAETGDSTFSTAISGVSVQAGDVLIYEFKVDSLAKGIAGVNVGLQIGSNWYFSPAVNYSDTNYHIVQFEIPAVGTLSKIYFNVKYAAASVVSVYEYRIIRSTQNNAPNEPVKGDLDENFQVNLRDFGIIANQWMTNPVVYTTNTCDSLAQFDNCASMTLSIIAGGPSGNYLNAIPNFDNATVAWKSNGTLGMTVTSGDKLSFDAAGYANDFKVTVLIGSTYYTLRAYNTFPLLGTWTPFEYSIPASGTLKQVEFSVYSHAQQCSLDNLKIGHASSAISDLNNDAQVNILDLEIFAEHWLQCTRTDCI